MEFWNTRNMLAPPTYTYEANSDDIDISHFKSILQDGISFYNDQNLLNLEVALLSRIIYRMKTKFRNSKDFQTFEKVKKDLNIFEGINISKKLEYLFSLLPSLDYHDVVVSLPTKNMIDFILVQLQGIGKILCRAIETCKHTVIIYEHRLYLGHFWKMALVAIALVSRIHILCLNIIKFTCLLYLRLVPFSHKLKNVTMNWLPKEYVFPKDLKTWLNIEWSKLEEVIEVPDHEFNMSLIDLVEDSDDDVEFIEVNDDIEIFEDFRKIRRYQVNKLDFESVNALTSKNLIDIGEEIVIEESDVQIGIPDENTLNETGEISSLKKDDEVRSTAYINNEMDIGDVISSPKDLTVKQKQHQKTTEIDIGEVILSDDEIFNEQFQVPEVQLVEKNKILRNESCKVIVSSSDDEDDKTSVQFVNETVLSRKPCVTSEFIPLETSTPSLATNVQQVKYRARKRKSKKKTNNSASVVLIPDSPNNSTLKNNISKNKTKKVKELAKNLKRKSTENTGKNKIPDKKKKKKN